MEALAVYAWPLIPFAAFLVPWLLRKYAPGVWIVIEKLGPSAKPLSNVFQALPSALTGAAVAAMSNGMDPYHAMLGVALAMLAPIAHHILKALPVPYRGAVVEYAKIFKWPNMLVLLVLLSGCSASVAQREACYVEARARFHLNAEQCETEACIDELSLVETEELKECRH